MSLKLRKILKRTTKGLKQGLLSLLCVTKSSQGENSLHSDHVCQDGKVSEQSFISDVSDIRIISDDSDQGLVSDFSEQGLVSDDRAQGVVSDFHMEDLPQSRVSADGVHICKYSGQQVVVPDTTDWVRAPTDWVGEPTDWVRQPTDWVRAPTDWVRQPYDWVGEPTDWVGEPTDWVRAELLQSRGFF